MTWVMSRSEYDEMATRYDDGRARPLAHFDGWRRALHRFLPVGRAEPVVDVGSGTGIWSHALAAWFDVYVVGVEPSGGMRMQAIAKRSRPNVSYVGGRCDALPLAAASCGAVWLSTVIHHFHDLHAAAVELRRVVRPGAPVLIREGFTGRTDGIPWLRYFPEALPITEEFWPTVDMVVDAFEPAGFGFESVEPVEQVTANNLREYADLIRVRADSTLIRLTDGEFEAGMRRLERDAASPVGDRPVISALDLLVLR
jgi:ubiquinone/menaquinone biosynthesis C-methylase UbiE